MYGLLPTQRNNRSSYLLGRGRHLHDEAQLVRANFPNGLKRSHGTVLAVDTHVEDVTAGSSIVCKHFSCSDFDSFCKASNPRINLSDDVRVPDRSNDYTLIADALGSFQLDRIFI